MDAVNERAVFSIVEEAIQESGGQFILITPKLLPELPLEHSTVLCVFNGPHQMGQKEWDSAMAAITK
jgi:hypothetical protein